MSDNFFAESISESVGDLLAMDSPEKIPVVTATVEFLVDESHLADYVENYGKLETTVKSDEKDVNVLRARHHGVARLLASGIPEGVVADLTNFTPAYISVLKNSPSFAQLLAHYRAPGKQAAEMLQERLRTVAHGSLESLAAKLEDGKLSANEEIQLAKLGFDRSGVGPQSTVKQENTSTVFDVAEIMRLAQDARRKDAARTIDIEEVRRALPAPTKRDEDAAA